MHIVLCTNVEDLAQAARDFSTAGALRTTAIFCQQMYDRTKNESRRPHMDEMHLGLVGIVAYNDVRDDPASKLHTRSDQRRL